jgi:hypothetical protein
MKNNRHARREIRAHISPLPNWIICVWKNMKKCHPRKMWCRKNHNLSCILIRKAIKGNNERHLTDSGMIMSNTMHHMPVLMKGASNFYAAFQCGVDVQSSSASSVAGPWSRDHVVTLPLLVLPLHFLSGVSLFLVACNKENISRGGCRAMRIKKLPTNIWYY